jgi:hypothetical protein
MTNDPTTIALRCAGAVLLEFANRTYRAESGVGRVDPQRTPHPGAMGEAHVATRHDRVDDPELLCVRNRRRVRCRHHHRPPPRPSPGPLVRDRRCARARLADLPRPSPHTRRGRTRRQSMVASCTRLRRRAARPDCRPNHRPNATTRPFGSTSAAEPTMNPRAEPLSVTVADWPPLPSVRWPRAASSMSTVSPADRDEGRDPGECVVHHDTLPGEVWTLPPDGRVRWCVAARLPVKPTRSFVTRGQALRVDRRSSATPTRKNESPTPNRRTT